MTTTTRAAVAAHHLVRRIGARSGAFHAALLELEGWRTACGELLTDGPRGTVHAWAPADAQAELEAHQAVPICRRCDRVGDSL